MTILRAILEGIAAVLTAASLTLVPPAPWQRQETETCESYLSRVEANDFDLWRQHWCGTGPCWRVVVRDGTGYRTAEGFAMHHYWTEKQHGCQW